MFEIELAVMEIVCIISELAVMDIVRIISELAVMEIVHIISELAVMYIVHIISELAVMDIVSIISEHRKKKGAWSEPKGLLSIALFSSNRIPIFHVKCF